MKSKQANLIRFDSILLDLAPGWISFLKQKSRNCKTLYGFKGKQVKISLIPKLRQQASTHSGHVCLLSIVKPGVF